MLRDTQVWAVHAAAEWRLRTRLEHTAAVRLLRLALPPQPPTLPRPNAAVAATACVQEAIVVAVVVAVVILVLGL